MRRIFKFGWLPENDYAQEQPYEYPDIFAVEKTSGPERLVIAPSGQQVALISDFLEIMQEPLGVLYVLTVPRGGATEGRYQSANALAKDDVRAFLKKFGKFFENDGRHHLWIVSMPSSDMLVFDNHNLIYAYGSLSVFEVLAEHRGLKKVDRVRVPAPHCHKYNEVFDQDEQHLLSYWDWKRFPLTDADD